MRKINLHLGMMLTLMLAMSVSSFAQTATKQCLDSIVPPRSYKEVFAYNSKGNNTLQIIYKWDNGISDWKGYEKYEFTTYDSKGNRTSRISYYWYDRISDWVKNNKSEYTYDSMGNQTLQIYYNWDNGISDWVKYRKDEYTYDSKGNQTLQIIYTWDNGISDWKGSEKYEYTYDSKGNQTERIIYTWDSGISDLVKSGKNEYTYNLSYSREDLVMPIAYATDALFLGNMLTGQTNYSWADTGWVRGNVTTYYWSGREIDTTNIDETGIVETHCNASLRVYPNPAGNQLTIDCRDGARPVPTETNYVIYSVMGQVVMTSPNPSKGGELAPSPLERAGGEVVIDVSHLPAGIYFLKVQTKTNTIINKIVKQ